MTRVSVLVVEDEEGWQSILRDCLEDAGYALLTATSLVEAIVLATQHRPEVALMDLVLSFDVSRCSGLEFAEFLVREELGTRVIAVTGYPSLLESTEMVRSGLVFAVLHKAEFDRGYLVELIGYPLNSRISLD